MSCLIHKVGFCLTNYFPSKMFITVNLLLWTDVSLLNMLGCFPSFHNSSKNFCIVLWRSRWENFNPFCYFWFGPIMTLSLIIKLSPIVWQGTCTIFIHLYLLTYTRVFPIMSLECYIKALTSYSIILIFHSLSFESGFHLNLWQNWKQLSSLHQFLSTCLSESIKKGTFVTKIFFLLSVE